MDFRWTGFTNTLSIFYLTRFWFSNMMWMIFALSFLSFIIYIQSHDMVMNSEAFNSPYMWIYVHICEYPNSYPTAYCYIQELYLGAGQSIPLTNVKRICMYMWKALSIWKTREGGVQKCLRALKSKSSKSSPVNKRHIFHCMGKIVCVEFQRVPLKFHTKYLTHTLKDTIFVPF